MNLEDLAHKIQGLDKSHHIEILRLIKETNPSCSISENKNGCFINMNLGVGNIPIFSYIAIIFQYRL